MLRNINQTGKNTMQLSNKMFITLFLTILFALVLATTFLLAYSRTSKSAKEPSQSIKFKGYYMFMTPDMQDAYKTMYIGIAKMEKNIKIRLPEQKVKQVFYCLMFDNPEFIHLSDAYSYDRRDGVATVFHPKYIMEKEEYDEKKEEMNAVKEEVISTISSMSDYDKSLYVHDYIASRCSYMKIDEPLLSNSRVVLASQSNEAQRSNEIHDRALYTAYDAIIEGKANCRGYSAAYQYLLNAAGVESGQCIGTIKNEEGLTEGHSWNYVMIDGIPCYTDVCLDDANFEGFSMHGFFNISRNEMAATHDFANNDMLLYPIKDKQMPESYGYYIKKKLMAGSLKEAYGIINKRYKSLSHGEIIEIKCHTGSVFDEVCSNIEIILKRISQETGNNIKNIKITKIKDMYIIVIS